MDSFKAIQELSLSQARNSPAFEPVELQRSEPTVEEVCETIGHSLLELVDNFAMLCKQGIVKNKTRISHTIQEGIGNIDRILHRQLNEILHHQAFQQLEATWRGVRYLTKHTNPSQNIKVRLLSAKKEEIKRDMDRAIEFDRSALFKLIYEAEFGTFGGEPFGILVGDYEFSGIPQDVAMLKDIAGVVAASHAMFITGTAPTMLDMDRFGQLDTPKNLPKLFKQKEWSKWREFRKSEDARYVAMTLPRVLYRCPYGRRKDRIHPGPIYLEEKVGGVHPDKYLWGNASYVLAAKICDSFRGTGGFSSFYGLEGGGIVDDLPVPTFDAIPIPKMSVDVCIPDEMERTLSNLGFICLLHRRWTTDSIFYGHKTTQLPSKRWTRQARQSAELATMVPQVLMASRFAHYLKTIVRNKIGTFQHKQELQLYLRKWLQQYIQLDPTASREVKTKYPLQSGKIELIESPDSPGLYKMVLQLTPHVELDHCSASIQLFANVPTNNG